MMSDEEREPSASGVGDEGLNELGRRLAAAFVSHTEGRKTVDRTLREAPRQVDQFWKEIADLIYVAMGMRTTKSKELGDLRLREVITKLIQ